MRECYYAKHNSVQREIEVFSLIELQMIWLISHASKQYAAQFLFTPIESFDERVCRMFFFFCSSILPLLCFNIDFNLWFYSWCAINRGPSDEKRKNERSSSFNFLRIVDWTMPFIYHLNVFVHMYIQSSRKWRDHRDLLLDLVFVFWLERTQHFAICSSN